MMTPKKTFFALCLLILSSQILAGDYLMFIGAGGEAAGPTTLFDNNIKKLGDYVKKNPGLKVDVALNGGHSTTEALIAESFPNVESKSDFLESDYKRLIASYKLKLENNEMGPGDQLMIYVDSHGAQKESQYKTHRIATSAGTATDLNSLKGSSVVDLDQLEILKKLAKEKGVKMAIIDGSCHSGNTLALADDNTCVISSTGPNHYGYSPFSEKFSAAMEKGKNLEEIFLAVRAKDGTPAFPMISTQPGVTVNSLMYSKITPFLYHFDNNHDKLTPYLQAHSSEYQQCLANESYNALMETINSIEALNALTTKVLWTTIEKKEIDLTKLKTLLGNYKKSLDLVTLKMNELKIDRLVKIETFKVKATVGRYSTAWSQDYTWKELIDSDFTKLIIETQDKIKAEKDESTLTSYQGVLSLYTQANAKKEELLRTQPDLITVKTKEAEIKKLIDSTYFTNALIATEERKLYSALYNKAQEALPETQVNPCKSFKL